MIFFVSAQYSETNESCRIMTFELPNKIDYEAVREKFGSPHP